LGVPADIASAERSYRSAAERNHVSAQLALADLIAARATSDEERLEATRWYRLAADNGNKVAKLRVGETRVGETEENRATSESGEPLKTASTVL
jgi:TPR repeat protein